MRRHCRSTNRHCSRRSSSLSSSVDWLLRARVRRAGTTLGSRSSDVGARRARVRRLLGLLRRARRTRGRNEGRRNGERRKGSFSAARRVAARRDHGARGMHRRERNGDVARAGLRDNALDSRDPDASGPRVRPRRARRRRQSPRRRARRWGHRRPGPSETPLSASFEQGLGPGTIPSVPTGHIATYGSESPCSERAAVAHSGRIARGVPVRVWAREKYCATTAGRVAPGPMTAPSKSSPGAALSVSQRVPCQESRRSARAGTRVERPSPTHVTRDGSSSGRRAPGRCTGRGNHERGRLRGRSRSAGERERKQRRPAIHDAQRPYGSIVCRIGGRDHGTPGEDRCECARQLRGDRKAGACHEGIERHAVREEAGRNGEPRLGRRHGRQALG